MHQSQSKDTHSNSNLVVMMKALTNAKRHQQMHYSNQQAATHILQNNDESNGQMRGMAHTMCRAGRMSISLSVPLSEILSYVELLPDE